MEQRDFSAGEILLFDKPKSWTSFDVVKKVRAAISRYTGSRVKVGHAGTLDPLATGLVILCTGKATKRIESLQGLAKGYEVEMKFGATTPSYDAEFPEENIQDVSHLTQSDVEEAIRAFQGEILQYPPIFSAVKIGGKRAYKAARKGQAIEVRPRVVHVYDFYVTKFNGPASVHAFVGCSKGTYIRSLAHDLGQVLGFGAYIQELRRTYIGEYRVEDAWQIDDFVAELDKKSG